MSRSAAPRKQRPLDPRSAAVRTLAKVLGEGRSLSAALPPVQREVAPGDAALVQELCYGVLRWHPRLEALLAQLLDKPLKAKDLEVQVLLLVGLYQLIELRIPDHAAVSETVAVAARLNRPWARGLVNAVLRRFLRDRTSLLEALAGDETATTAHPPWLLEALKADWPAQWQDLVAANNARPPLTLRVNRRRRSRAEYLQDLAHAGIEACATPHSPDGVRLTIPCPVERLPGFQQGWVSVQDEAAQLAAPLLDLQPGQRVLDACAAPGGKTAHILEAQPDLGGVTALDLSAERLARVGETLGRLGLAAELVCGDGASPDQWWDGRPFDRILLDAPCSATGVIRRHPDIKILRRAEDLAALVETQRRILNTLWPLLRPGGMLVYATCSVLRRENEHQVARFLADHREARERPIQAGWGRAVTAGRQILPGEDEMDGFFYASLEKEQ